MDLRDHTPTLSDHPVDVGHRTEGAILSELVRRGYAVLVPFGVNQRYDLVIDIEGRFLRGQCKTGRLIDGVVRFTTQSVRSNRRRTFTRGYIGDADIFWSIALRLTASMLSRSRMRLAAACTCAWIRP